MVPTDPDTPIDAVVTWVDGNTPSHRAVRAAYMAQSGRRLHENASNPHRWASSDEIYFCLHSIVRHAPWVRWIWVLVEREKPDLDRLSDAVRAKLRFAYHHEIFAGHEHVLPTFNSLAIETMMWRIAGLSERFLYFNDDVFLKAPLSPDDMFRGDRPVLRGAWVDYSALASDARLREDPARFNHFMQINAAALCGMGPGHLFAAAHVVHPMRRSVMARLYAEHRAAFLANIGHRFRDLSQFLPQGLHNHACIGAGEAVQSTAADHLHITSGQGAGGDPEAVRALLERDALAGTKFLCVNDLPQLEDLLPDARELIWRAIGGAPQHHAWLSR